MQFDEIWSYLNGTRELLPYTLIIICRLAHEIHRLVLKIHLLLRKINSLLYLDNGYFKVLVLSVWRIWPVTLKSQYVFTDVR